jgi:WD40 repeat protein
MNKSRKLGVLVLATLLGSVGCHSTANGSVQGGATEITNGLKGYSKFIILKRKALLSRRCVRDVKIGKSGDFIAAIDDNGWLYLWKLPSEKMYLQKKVCKKTAHTIAIDKRESVVGIVCGDGRIAIVDKKQGKVIRRLQSFDDGTGTQIVFLKNLHQLLIGTRREIVLVNWKNGVVRLRKKANAAIVWMWKTNDPKMFMVYTSSSTFEIWNTENMRLIEKYLISWSDGVTFEDQYNRIISWGYFNSRICVVHRKGGKMVLITDSKKVTSRDAIHDALFIPDEKYVLIMAGDSSARVKNAASKALNDLILWDYVSNRVVWKVHLRGILTPSRIALSPKYNILLIGHCDKLEILRIKWIHS